MEWYILKVQSGYETNVLEEMQRVISSFSLDDYFGDIMVPEEDSYMIKNGKKVKSRKKFFPGYVIVNMSMNDKTWHAIKNIQRVTGFLGDKDKPQAISKREISKIIDQLENVNNKVEQKIIYELGETVKIIDGPFESFTGAVEGILDNNRLKVSVSIFGRSTPVELEITQVSKMEDLN
ncbi:MAG: transcription termination/antitermination protein NusG [Pseudomonadota bacterium]